MFCNKCGNNVPDGFKFCNKCGAPVVALNNAKKVQPQAPVQQKPPVQQQAPMQQKPPVQQQAPVQQKPPVQQPVNNMQARPAQPPVNNMQARPGQLIKPSRPVTPASTPNPAATDKKKKQKLITLIGLAAAFILLLIVAAVWNDTPKRDASESSNTQSTTQYTTQATTQATTTEATTQATTQAPTTTEATTQATTEEPFQTYTDDMEVTVILYVVASDLESGPLSDNGTYDEPRGSATWILDDFVAQNYPKNVHVVVQTGGTGYWKNSYGMKNGKTQRFHVEGNKFVEDKDLGTTCMTEEETLEDFLKWTKKNYPADRYMLFMYDHGCSGTDTTFGSDKVANHKDRLKTYDIANAIDNAGLHMDITILSCCMMGTLEMASELDGISDYFIGAEEVSITGKKKFDKLLNLLCEHPGTDSVTLGKAYVDKMASLYQNVTDHQYHFAMVNTKKAKKAADEFNKFIKKADDELYAGNADRYLTARANCGSFGSGSSQEVDVVEFCKLYNIAGSNDVIDALEDCIVYQKTDIPYANGLTVYLPANDTYAIERYSSIGRGHVKKLNGYSNLNTFIADYITVLGVYSYSDQLSTLGINDYYNKKLADVYLGNAQQYAQDDIHLDTVKKNGKYYLAFDSKDYIYTVEKRVGYEFKDGRAVALGSDFRADVTSDGMVDVSFPETWTAVNGQIVCYVVTDQSFGSDGKFRATAVIPFVFADTYEHTGEMYGLIINWEQNDQGKKNGKLAGYSRIDLDTFTVDSAIWNLQVGDKIQFMYALVSHDGTNLDQNSVSFDPLISNVITYDSKGLSLSFEKLSDFEKQLDDAYTNDFVGYTYGYITDIYGQTYISDLIPAK